jgi:hypothetical protein
MTDNNPFDLSTCEAIYGYPEEWKAFADSHADLIERWPNIEKAIALALHRSHSNADAGQKIIYFLGRLALEEFLEILLFCGNGYGIGAQKILRGMCERQVTARYLHKHPEEVKAYMEFHHVSDYKLMMAGHDSVDNKSWLSQERTDAIKENYERVKKDFLVTACRECGTTRMNHTWNKKDIVSMAREFPELLKLLLPAYLLPTREFHSTLGAILSRLDFVNSKPGERLLFDSDLQRGRANEALMWAHAILIDALDLQREVFGMADLEKPLQVCADDFGAVWNSGRTRTPQPPSPPFVPPQ